MYRIGVDLGGTKIEIIVLNQARQEIYRKRIPTEQKMVIKQFWVKLEGFIRKSLPLLTINPIRLG